MRRAILLTLFAAGAALAFGSGAPPTITVEAASLGGLSSLSVRCEVRGAEVRLDGLARGSVPLDIAGLRPGGHTLAIAAPGHYELTMYLSLAADTKTTVEASLERKTGYIEFRSDTPGATLGLSGKDYPPGMIEAPAGTVTFTVRAFGYVEKQFSVSVAERMVSTVDASLEKAAFEAGSYSISASRFNPLNAGGRGTVRLRYRVSAPGYGRATVIASSGASVLARELGPFSGWDQAFEWDGKLGSGEAAPDGKYLLRLELGPERAQDAADWSFVHERSVEVDSSLVVVPGGSFGALPGAAHGPQALAPASDGFRVDASAFVRQALGAEATSGVAAIGASYSSAGLLEAGLGVELGFDEPSAALVALRVAAPLPSPFGLSAFADGRIGVAGDPAWARAGLAFGLGTRFANAVAAPGLVVRFDGGASLRADARAALRLGTYAVGAALSAEATTGPLSEGIVLDWPLASSIEAYLTPRGLPFTFRALAGLDWSPAPSAWRLGFGVAAEF